MYDRPELEEVHDRFWGEIRGALRERDISAPDMLSRDLTEVAVWTNPGLVLSQTYGMPYRLWLHKNVDFVGTPDYGLEGCPRGYYRSVFVARRDDPRKGLRDFADSIFAYNDQQSQSGFNAPLLHVNKQGFAFGEFLCTGQHRESGRSVADGRADLASLDAMTWRNIQAFDEFAGALKEVEFTKPTPGLPLVTAKGNDGHLIFDAVSKAIESLSALDRTTLGICGLVAIPEETYFSVPISAEVRG